MTGSCSRAQTASKRFLIFSSSCMTTLVTSAACALPPSGQSREKPHAIRGSKSISRRAGTILTVWWRRSGSCSRKVKSLRKLHRFVTLLTFVTSLWIKPKPHFTALGVGFRLPAMLLRRRLEGAQTTDLLENPLGVQLVFQPLQRAIDRFTFTNNHFWHQSSLPEFSNLS